jgi:hypothetical protein
MHTKVQQFGHYFANVARELKSKAFPLVNFAWRHNNNTQGLRTNKISSFHSFLQFLLRKNYDH